MFENYVCVAERCQECEESFHAALKAALGVQGVLSGPSRRVNQKSNPVKEAGAAAGQYEKTSVNVVPFDKSGEPVGPCKLALRKCWPCKVTTKQV